MEKKTIVFIIMDGLGDRPTYKLKDRTPMEAAYTPNMDYMARNGKAGMIYPVKQGLVCGSDTSHLSLLGYDPLKVYTGRGPFEAMGLGMDVMAGDIAFRANYSTRKGRIVLDRRAGRIEESTEPLSRAISIEVDGMKIDVSSGVEHRAALVMHGPGLSPEVSDTDPHENGKEIHKSEPKNENAISTTRILEKYLEKSRTILDEHPINRKRIADGKMPANELLLRGAGKAPDLEPFHEKYSMNGSYIIGIPMIKGLAKMIGMKEIPVKGMTGGHNTNYNGKLVAASENIGRSDFILMNIKAPDAAAHDRNPERKLEAMERIDAAMKNILGREDESLIVLTGDHSTSSMSGEHTGDPVPVVFYTAGIGKQSATGFNEKHCSRTGFTMESGDAMNYSLQLVDRLEKYGA